MQLVHHRLAVSLVMQQPLLGRQLQLLALGVGPVDFPDLFEHQSALARESWSIGRRNSRLPWPKQLASIESNFPQVLRESASHIWMGGGKAAARCCSTPAKFSPAWRHPVMNKTTG